MKKYNIKEVLDKVFMNTNHFGKSKAIRFDFDGDCIKMNSQRQIFKINGTDCVSCGIEGLYFRKDDGDNNRKHFNLYALDNDGNEVLMTKDHIIPKSKGGANHINNYQTMCCVCNRKKGNKIE